MKVALTIAGSDPSGGAGLQADLKTFHQFGVYGMSAITLITVQNTMTVDRVEVLDPSLVSEQLDAVLSDIRPDAIKLGALGNASVIEAISPMLKKWNGKLVVDPVMVSTQGASLFDKKALELFRNLILNQAYLVTPNVQEAEILSGQSIVNYDDFVSAAKTIRDLGARYVLIKGGHMEGDSIKDYFLKDDSDSWYESSRVETRNTHGTGCTLSAAITASLAKGCSLEECVNLAENFISRAIKEDLKLGQGHGPVNHFVASSQERHSSDR